MLRIKNPYKFDVKIIARDPAVQRMFERRTLAAETRRNYLKGIRFFCEHFSQQPSELVKHFKALSPDEIVDEFAEYFVWAKDRVAPKSAWAWLPGVRALLLENGVREVDRVGREIAREFRRKFGPAKPLLKRDVVTKEEIVKIMKVAPKRERAIIATIASSGLRLSSTLSLQLKHFRDDIWNLELPCYSIEIPESLSKEGEPYITFLSSEATEYIRDMLLERQAQEEDIGPETYLFVTERQKNPLSTKRFENAWRELCRKAELDMRPVVIVGFQPVGKKGGGVRLRKGAVRYNTRIHSLRKFFKTTCSINGVDRMASEAMLGHSLTQFGIESIYDCCATRKDWLREEYQKILRTVTFLKPVPALPVENHEARKKIEMLEEQNKKLNREIGELKDDLANLLNTPKLLEELKNLEEEMLRSSKLMHKVTAQANMLTKDITQKGKIRRKRKATD